MFSPFVLASVENDVSIVRMTISDPEAGISPKNLLHMFNQGFTTKKGVHGFGLHSAMRLAKSMQGTVSVHSDGEGKGVGFALDLPYRIEAVLA